MGGLVGFCVNPIIDASHCVSRLQYVNARALLKSKGLISGEAVLCDLKLTEQTVPVECFSSQKRQREAEHCVFTSAESGEQMVESVHTLFYMSLWPHCACMHEG